MPKPIVFISHSAKDDLAKQVLGRLYVALGEKFEVLLDRKRLHANMLWRRELETWMGLCHCAVIIFSKDAVESEWVRAEATVLKVRRTWDANFMLIGIKLPGVKSADLEGGGFGPAGLTELQMISAATADEALEGVRQLLDPLAESFQQKTPLGELEEWIASQLYEVEQKQPKALLEAAEQLGKSFGAVLPNVSYRQRLARELLSADVGRMADAVEKLVPYFEVKAKAIRLIDILMAFWVKHDAVGLLPQVVQRPRRQRAVSVNGVISPFTQETYIRRARCHPTDWIMVQTTGGAGLEVDIEEQVADIEEEIHTQLKKKFGVPANFPEPLARRLIDQEVTKRETTEPLFFIVPREVADDVVERLREKFPAFTFFLLAGDEVPDAAKLGSRHIQLLQPALEPGQELTALSLYLQARSKVENTGYGGEG